MTAQAHAAESPSAYVLAGPTGAGKTAVAHALALRMDRDILAADSMTVYRGMNIGTAKPTARERAEVLYWGLDLADPCEAFSVGRFVEHAREAAAESARRGRGLIVVGGSGLYLQALTEGLAPLPDARPALRARIEGLTDRRGIEGLRRALRRRDPARLAGLPDPSNPRRLQRALELSLSGAPAPRDWGASAGPTVDGLTWPRDALVRRIEQRVRAMYAAGLIEEARALRKRFPEWSATARMAIGYAEALDALDGRCSEDEAMRVTARRTRQLARRQRTWFRNRMRVRWLEASESDPVETLIERIAQRWNEHDAIPLIL